MRFLYVLSIFLLALGSVTVFNFFDDFSDFFEVWV